MQIFSNPLRNKQLDQDFHMTKDFAKSIFTFSYRNSWLYGDGGVVVPFNLLFWNLVSTVDVKREYIGPVAVTSMYVHVVYMYLPYVLYVLCVIALFYRYAQFQKHYTLDQVKSSKMIHFPLTKLQCS